MRESPTDAAYAHHGSAPGTVGHGRARTAGMPIDDKEKPAVNATTTTIIVLPQVGDVITGLSTVDQTEYTGVITAVIPPQDGGVLFPDGSAATSSPPPPRPMTRWERRSR